MNIVLLGNGFDMNYRLLTSYKNFLLTIDFLRKQKIDTIHSVSDVYGNPMLTSADKSIKESYEHYKDIYDKVLLETNVIKRIINLANGNLWFEYLLKSFNKDVGWIDFETEIAYVVKSFQSVFSQAKSSKILINTLEDGGIQYIIQDAFNFFLKNTREESWYIGVRSVATDFTIEYPLHSKNLVIDKEKIIGRLQKDLLNLAEILKLYLQYFVEATTSALLEQSNIEPLKVLNYADAVITFNYTNTYECFNNAADVFHIHGNVHSNIVLGINSDKYDELESTDTSFITFKKYYQRTLYETDVPYLRWLRSILDEDSRYKDIHLVVFGHSLDITDKDIIKDLFDIASKITIFYHNDEAKALYIRKLVSMFGRTKFEQIRDEQELRFLLSTIEHSDFSEEMKMNSTIQYKNNFEDNVIDPLVYN